MKKNKARNNQKKKQEKALKEVFRKKIDRKAKLALGRLDVVRKKTIASQPKSLDLGQHVTFPICDGVGECCKNRPIFVEPSDVYRIIHNERARQVFNLETTMDLYPKDGKRSVLFYFVDKYSSLPNCFIYRVKLSSLIEGKSFVPGVEVKDEDQVCPFFVFEESGKPDCILGKDRLTQCLSDPIYRMNRLNDRRRFSSWEYGLVKEPCIVCKQASEEQRTEVVKDWLQKKGLEERYIESDLLHNFIDWLRIQVSGEPSEIDYIWKTAACFLFDWDRFFIDYLKQPKEEVLKHGPTAPRDVYSVASKIMESFLMSRSMANIDKEKIS